MAEQKRQRESKKSEDIERLKIYREEMQGITRSILDLTRARQNLSEKIAEAKESTGQEIENHAVEEKLCSDMTEYAKRTGLDEDLARIIVKELIEYSKILQRKKIFFEYIKNHLRSSKIRTVSIIGAGRMGSWFANYLLETGTKVMLFDKVSAEAKSKELAGCDYAKTFEEAASADLIIVSVPIKETPAQIRKIINYSKKNPERSLKVIEISSVKNEITMAKLLDRNANPSNVEIYSIHPLFGPTANPYSVNSMISTAPTDASFVSGLFPQYRIFQMDARSHDELMSIMLTVPHAFALAFADSIAKHSKMIPENISGPSFDHMRELARRVLNESERVYYEIQSTNPFSEEAINDALGSMTRLRKTLRKSSEFKKFFREVKSPRG